MVASLRSDALLLGHCGNDSAQHQPFENAEQTDGQSRKGLDINIDILRRARV
jgi:hypothetical protein